MATLAHKVSPAQERRIIEALAAPSFEVSPETPTVTVRALITHGLAYHGPLRERVLDERGHLVRSHGVMLTDEGVAEARRLSGQDTITREDVARGAEDALQWLPRSARDTAAQAGPVTVLGMEFRRAGAAWRKLAKQGGRVPVELQALKHYNRVQDLLRAARRFEQEDAAEEAERTPEGAEDGRAVGFYVYVRNGEQRGFLLGPYATKAEADDNVSRARRYAEDQVAGACFYEYGSARAVAKPGRTLPMGKFNDRIGLRAEEGETMTEESTPVERVKHSKTAAGVLESLRAPGIGHGDAGDPDEQQAARAAAVADLADENGTCRGGEDRRPCETAMSGGECEHTEAAEQARARAAAVNEPSEFRGLTREDVAQDTARALEDMSAEDRAMVEGKAPSVILGLAFRRAQTAYCADRRERTPEEEAAYTRCADIASAAIIFERADDPEAAATARADDFRITNAERAEVAKRAEEARAAALVAEWAGAKRVGKYWVRTEEVGEDLVRVYVRGPHTEVDSIDRASLAYARAHGLRPGASAGGGEFFQGDYIAQRAYNRA